MRIDAENGEDLSASEFSGKFRRSDDDTVVATPTFEVDASEAYVEFVMILSKEQTAEFGDGVGVYYSIVWTYESDQPHTILTGQVEARKRA
jgi:hypothetical protein